MDSSPIAATRGDRATAAAAPAADANVDALVNLAAHEQQRDQEHDAPQGQSHASTTIANAARVSRVARSVERYAATANNTSASVKSSSRGVTVMPTSASA